MVLHPRAKASPPGHVESLHKNKRKHSLFGAPRAQKLRELGPRGCANRRNSLQLFCESACVLMKDDARVQRRDDANFPQKSREKFLDSFVWAFSPFFAILEKKAFVD